MTKIEYLYYWTDKIEPECVCSDDEEACRELLNSLKIVEEKTSEVIRPE